MSDRLPLVLLADAAAWAAVQVGTGYLVHRVPRRSLEDDGWLFREWGWERGGRLYTGGLRIRRWKRLLPEAGDVFAGGFSKARLQSHGREHLAAHARESRRAELGHWLALVPTPVFVAANPPALAPFMVAYAVAVNVPCIAAQRYNRIRLRRVLSRLDRPPMGAPGNAGAPADPMRR